jgi:hypothetical protein
MAVTVEEVVWAAALLVLLAASWAAMWQVFLRHVPVLANLKAVLLGEKQLPPRSKKHAVVFRQTGAGGASKAPGEF